MVVLRGGSESGLGGGFRGGSKSGSRTVNEFSEEGKGVEGIVLLIVVTCEVALLICARSLISVGITLYE